MLILASVDDAGVQLHRDGVADDLAQEARGIFSLAWCVGRCSVLHYDFDRVFP